MCCCLEQRETVIVKLRVSGEYTVIGTQGLKMMLGLKYYLVENPLLFMTFCLCPINVFACLLSSLWTCALSFKLLDSLHAAHSLRTLSGFCSTL